MMKGFSIKGYEEGLFLGLVLKKEFRLEPSSCKRISTFF